MKNRHSSEILSDFLEATKAVEIHTTAEEEEEIKQIAEDGLKREADSRRSAVENAKRKERENMLKEAKALVAAQAV